MDIHTVYTLHQITHVYCIHTNSGHSSFLLMLTYYSSSLYTRNYALILFLYVLVYVR